MDVIRVNVLTSPRLLADLIAAALARPPVRRWEPGEPPALISIINGDVPTNDSRVTIILGDRLDNPLSVIVDGRRSSRDPVPPHQLHNLILELADTMPSVPVEADRNQL